MMASIPSDADSGAAQCAPPLTALPLRLTVDPHARKRAHSLSPPSSPLVTFSGNGRPAHDPRPPSKQVASASRLPCQLPDQSVPPPELLPAYPLFGPDNKCWISPHALCRSLLPGMDTCGRAAFSHEVSAAVLEELRALHGRYLKHPVAREWFGDAEANPLHQLAYNSDLLARSFNERYPGCHPVLRRRPDLRRLLETEGGSCACKGGDEQPSARHLALHRLLDGHFEPELTSLVLAAHRQGARRQDRPSGPRYHLPRHVAYLARAVVMAARTCIGPRTADQLDRLLVLPAVGFFSAVERTTLEMLMAMLAGPVAAGFLWEAHAGFLEAMDGLVHVTGEWAAAHAPRQPGCLAAGDVDGNGGEDGI